MEADPSQPARPPLSPVPFARWLWQLAKDVIEEYRRDGVGDLAASITFWTLLSIPAAILAMVSALSSLTILPGVDQGVADDFERDVQELISDTFADSETLNEAVAELFAGSNAGVVTAASAVAIFSLSRGFAGLIRALDQAYDVEEGRPWWHVRLVAVGLGLATVVVVAALTVFLAILPELPGGTMTRALTVPLALIGMVLWAALLFHVAPNHRTPWRYDVPGALLTTVGWVLATQGFALYIRLSDQGNQVQTTVGAILLGLTLMYLLSIVMLIGAELNDVIARRAGVVQQPVPLKDRYEQVRDRLSEITEETPVSRWRR